MGSINTKTFDLPKITSQVGNVLGSHMDLSVCVSNYMFDHTRIKPNTSYSDFVDFKQHYESMLENPTDLVFIKAPIVVERDQSNQIVKRKVTRRSFIRDVQDKNIVYGYFLRNREVESVIIFFPCQHQNIGNMADITEKLSQLASLVIFDYREKDFSADTTEIDSVCIWKYVINNIQNDGSKIILMGHLGGCQNVAALCSYIYKHRLLEDYPKHIILQSPMMLSSISRLTNIVDIPVTNTIMIHDYQTFSPHTSVDIIHGTHNPLDINSDVKKIATSLSKYHKSVKMYPIYSNKASFFISPEWIYAFCEKVHVSDVSSE
jgi:hypothetical protein